MYVELALIKLKEAEEVANALFDTWISLNLTPICIVLDNGKEFCNKLMRCFLNILSMFMMNYHKDC